MTSIRDLLAGDLQIINIGLEAFAADLARHGATVLHVAWAPPAGGDTRRAALLAALDDEAEDP